MKKEYTGNDVTIVICAYKECEYLEESIQSVVNQTVKTNVVISTSTPNEFIQTLADKYGLSMWINKDGGHAKDYNFAINMTPTDICIMAHQDDLIHPDFVKESLVIGIQKDKKDEVYVHAQLLPDLDAIQEKLGLTNPSKDELEKLLKTAISEVNNKIPNYKHIKSFEVRLEEFEKTTTQKIKRYGKNINPEN